MANQTVVTLVLNDDFTPALAKINSATRNTTRQFAAMDSAVSKAASGSSDSMRGMAGATQSAGSRMAGAMRDTASSVVSSLGNIAAKGTATVAALGGVITGLTIKGGFTRAMNIEQAQAKLRGLGNSVEDVKNIMDSATQAVTGTPFGLDAAATAAAGARAAGIKTGKDMTRYLTLAGNAAAAMGIDISETGAIMNKVAASNRVEMEDLNTVMDRGLPIIQSLADTMGMPVEEVKKAVSSGKVGLAEYMTALEKASGTVADEMGNTLPGAIDNLKGAFSRVGAAFWQGASPGLVKAANGIKELLNRVLGANGDTIQAWGEKVGNGVAAIADRVSTVLDKTGNISIPPGISQFVGSLEQFVPLLAGAGGALLPLLSRLPVLSGLLGVLPAPVSAVAGAIALLVTSSAQLRGAFNSAFTALLPQVQSLVVSLMPVIQQLAQAVVQVATQIGDVFATAINALIPVVGQLLPVVSQVATFFGSVMVAALNTLTPLFPILNTVVQAVGTVLQILVPVIQAIMDVLQPVMSALPGIIQSLQPVIELIGQVVNVIIGILIPVIQLVSTVLTSVVIPIIGVLIGVITNIVSVVATVVTTIAGFIAVVIGVVTNMAVTITSGIENVMGFIPSVPGRIREAFAGAGSWLLNAGRQVMEGLKNGIMAGVNAVMDAVKSVGGKIVGGIKGALGIHSPSRVMRYQVAPYVTEGMAAGLMDTSNVVDLAARRTAQTALNGITPRYPDVQATSNNIVNFPNTSTTSTAPTQPVPAPVVNVSFGNVDSSVDVDALVDKIGAAVKSAYEAVVA